MVTNPTPPPSIEEVRDELCVKLIGETALISSNDETIDDYLRMNAIKGFEVGWSAALQELSRRAEGEFESHYAAWVDANGSRSPSIKTALQWMHARSWARIQELEAKASRLGTMYRTVVVDETAARAECSKLREALEWIESMGPDEAEIEAPRAAREALTKGCGGSGE